MVYDLRLCTRGLRLASAIVTGKHQENLLTASLLSLNRYRKYIISFSVTRGTTFLRLNTLFTTCRRRRAIDERGNARSHIYEYYNFFNDIIHEIFICRLRFIYRNEITVFTVKNLTVHSVQVSYLTVAGISLYHNTYYVK